MTQTTLDDSLPCTFHFHLQWCAPRHTYRCSIPNRFSQFFVSKRENQYFFFPLLYVFCITKARSQECERNRDHITNDGNSNYVKTCKIPKCMPHNVLITHTKKSHGNPFTYSWLHDQEKNI